jgi:hypothetical protein
VPENLPLFFKGNDQILSTISDRFAEVFGNHQRAVAIYSGPIAAQLVQQYRRHTAVFDAAMASSLPEEVILRQAAKEQGIHLYELAYGVPSAMADAFEVKAPHELMWLIKAGEFEPEVLEMLREENDYEPLAAGMFRDAMWTDAYALRAHFCSAFLGADSAYALLQMGIRPATDYKDSQKVIDSIILGASPAYAAQTKGNIDPPLVAKAYREGVPVEYLMEMK